MASDLAIIAKLENLLDTKLGDIDTSSLSLRPQSGYKADFLPRSVMPRFIVKLHKDIHEGTGCLTPRHER